MACSGCSSVKTVSTGRALVFSSCGTKPGDSEVFGLSPDSLIEIAPLLRRIRVTAIVSHLSGGTVQPVFQSTEDADEWSQPITLGKPIGQNGTFTGPWLAEEEAFKRGMRLGVVVSPSKGSPVAMGYVSLIIDVETI